MNFDYVKFCELGLRLVHASTSLQRVGSEPLHLFNHDHAYADAPSVTLLVEPSCFYRVSEATYTLLPQPLRTSITQLDYELLILMCAYKKMGLQGTLLDLPGLDGLLALLNGTFQLPWPAYIAVDAVSCYYSERYSTTVYHRPASHLYASGVSAGTIGAQNGYAYFGELLGLYQRSILADTPGFFDLDSSVSTTTSQWGLLFHHQDGSCRRCCADTVVCTSACIFATWMGLHVDGLHEDPCLSESCEPLWRSGHISIPECQSISAVLPAMWDTKVYLERIVC